MNIEEIIKVSGHNDYYELETGRLFKLSEMEYNLFRNVTKVPVIEPNRIVGYIELEGNYISGKRHEYDSPINNDLGILGGV